MCPNNSKRIVDLKSFNVPDPIFLSYNYMLDCTVCVCVYVILCLLLPVVNKYFGDKCQA